MRINPRIVIPTLSTAIGFVCGALVVAWLAFHCARENVGARAYITSVERVRLLRQLRSSRNGQAITEQEILLAGDISSLGDLVGWGKSTSQIKAGLERAAEYQKQFPDSFQYGDLRQEVNHVFSLVKP